MGFLFWSSQVAQDSEVFLEVSNHTGIDVYKSRLNESLRGGLMDQVASAGESAVLLDGYVASQWDASAC